MYVGHVGGDVIAMECCQVMKSQQCGTLLGTCSVMIVAIEYVIKKRHIAKECGQIMQASMGLLQLEGLPHLLSCLANERA
jgi:hypothetical protein